MQNEVTPLDEILDANGGPARVAQLLGITRQRLNGWRYSGSVPEARTGEVNFRVALAKLSGGKIKARELASFKPAIPGKSPRRKFRVQNLSKSNLRGI